MKNRLTIGDTKVYTHSVIEEDLAAFDAGTVHAVCSTFALAKHIEWSSRLFIIDIKEKDEEGIGTMIKIDHKSPAFANQKLLFKATIISINNNELVCDVLVSSKGRIIAKAKTGQKLLKKDRIKEIFSSLAHPKK
ncbi:MAG: hypothetical protein L3J29_10350 [Cyclobacteriaceae bacterium]|nr:hypothetical protein [Cyclobacteriaceae bacterium]